MSLFVIIVAYKAKRIRLIVIDMGRMASVDEDYLEANRVFYGHY